MVVLTELLIVGFWVDDLALYGALILVSTGIGGVLIHMRVKDGMKESMPILVLTFWQSFWYFH